MFSSLFVTYEKKRITPTMSEYILYCASYDYYSGCVLSLHLMTANDTRLNKRFISILCKYNENKEIYEHNSKILFHMFVKD